MCVWVCLIEILDHMQAKKKKKNPLFQRKSSGAQSVPQLTFPFSLPTGSITHMLDARNR